MYDTFLSFLLIPKFSISFSQYENFPEMLILLILKSNSRLYHQWISGGFGDKKT